MSQLAGSPHHCHRCKLLPEACQCVGCECGVCKSARIPKDQRDALTAADKALEVSPEQATKLSEKARADEAKRIERDEQERQELAAKQAEIDARVAHDNAP